MAPALFKVTGAYDSVEVEFVGLGESIDSLKALISANFEWSDASWADSVPFSWSVLPDDDTVRYCAYRTDVRNIYATRFVILSDVPTIVDTNMYKQFLFSTDTTTTCSLSKDGDVVL